MVELFFCNIVNRVQKKQNSGENIIAAQRGLCLIGVKYNLISRDQCFNLSKDKLLTGGRSLYSIR